MRCRYYAGSYLRNVNILLWRQGSYWPPKKRKFKCKKRAQNEQRHEKLARPPQRLTYTWHGSEKNAKCYNLCSYEDGGLLCYAKRWQPIVHTVISPPNKITYAYPVCPLAQYLLREVFTPTFHVVFVKHPKMRNHKAENGSNFDREKKDPKLWNVVDKSSQKILRGWTLEWCFVKGHVDPSYLYLMSVFYALIVSRFV